MTQTDSHEDLLERARMHEQLASATDDSAARTIHQAMAKEFRRRAAELQTIRIQPTPRMEIYSAAK